MSLLSAAVVVIAVAIAAIGLGATAEDAGAEQKSRLFVVSGAALVQHCQGERDNRFFSHRLSYFSLHHNSLLLEEERMFSSFKSIPPVISETASCGIIQHCRCNRCALQQRFDSLPLRFCFLSQIYLSFAHFFIYFSDRARLAILFSILVHRWPLRFQQSS